MNKIPTKLYEFNSYNPPLFLLYASMPSDLYVDLGPFPLPFRNILSFGVFICFVFNTPQFTSIDNAGSMSPYSRSIISGAASSSDS